MLQDNKFLQVHPPPPPHQSTVSYNGVLLSSISALFSFFHLYDPSAQVEDKSKDTTCDLYDMSVCMYM